MIASSGEQEIFSTIVFVGDGPQEMFSSRILLDLAGTSVVCSWTPIVLAGS